MPMIAMSYYIDTQLVKARPTMSCIRLVVMHEGTINLINSNPLVPGIVVIIKGQPSLDLIPCIIFDNVHAVHRFPIQLQWHVAVSKAYREKRACNAQCSQ